jgi:hypothetical protein
MVAKHDLIEKSKGSLADEFLNSKQKEAVAFFKDNLDTWVNDPLYKYKYVIIKDKTIVGRFDTFGAAITDAVPRYPENDFIVQQIISDKDFVSFLIPSLV